MAKLGKKADHVSCMCTTTKNNEGSNCECWDTKGNPIVLAKSIVLRKIEHPERYTAHPERVRR